MRLSLMVERLKLSVFDVTDEKAYYIGNKRDFVKGDGELSYLVQ